MGKPLLSSPLVQQQVPGHAPQRGLHTPSLCRGIRRRNAGAWPPTIPHEKLGKAPQGSNLSRRLLAQHPAIFIRRLPWAWCKAELTRQPAKSPVGARDKSTIRIEASPPGSEQRQAKYNHRDKQRQQGYIQQYGIAYTTCPLYTRTACRRIWWWRWLMMRQRSILRSSSVRWVPFRRDRRSSPSIRRMRGNHPSTVSRTRRTR